MKILITGAQGQVGKELVSIANQRGFNVIAAGQTELDITQLKDIESYVEVLQPDLVINAAAYTEVNKAEKEQDITYAINRDGAANLAAVSKEKKYSVITYLKPIMFFDGTKSEAYSENDAVSPLGIYGISKWQGEETIRQTLPEHIILRVAWVFWCTR